MSDFHQFSPMPSTGTLQRVLERRPTASSPLQATRLRPPARRYDGLRDLLRRVACGLGWTAWPFRPLERVLPNGLALIQPTGFELTWQTLAPYSPDREVLATWAGDALRYYSVVYRLPAGYTDAREYFAAMVRDFRAGRIQVSISEGHPYAAARGLHGVAVVLYLQLTPDAPGSVQVNHFLTDGTHAFLVVSPVTGKAVDEMGMLAETIRLFRSAWIADPQGSEPQSDSELIGVWRAQETGPGGHPLESTMDMRPDCSFVAEVRLANTLVQRMSGIWLRTDEGIQWRYLYSAPQLPESLVEDEDRILLQEATTLVVQSALTRKVHTFRRVSPA